jgi:hypothetical protein
MDQVLTDVYFLSSVASTFVYVEGVRGGFYGFKIVRLTWGISRQVSECGDLYLISTSSPHHLHRPCTVVGVAR